MRIVIDRPAKQNALNKAMYEATDRRLRPGRRRRGDSRASCCRARAATFTAGNDLEDFRRPLDNLQEFPGAALRPRARRAADADRRRRRRRRGRRRRDHAVPLRSRLCRRRARASACPSSISASCRRRARRCSRRSASASPRRANCCCSATSFDATEALRLGLVNRGRRREEVEEIGARRRAAVSPRSRARRSRRRGGCCAAMRRRSPQRHRGGGGAVRRRAGDARVRARGSRPFSPASAGRRGASYSSPKLP